MAFDLGERDVTIIVKNGSRPDPENTVFKMNDTYYRGSYLVRDFLAVGKEGLNMSFNNMHCDYQANVKIDPNVYMKYVTIAYGYNPNGECIYKVTPQEYARLTTVKVTPKSDILTTIKLNDLNIVNMLAYFVFGLFLAITLGIRYVEKKRVLVYNKSNN